jgi:hypothetical protein
MLKLVRSDRGCVAILEKVYLDKEEPLWTSD